MDPQLQKAEEEIAAMRRELSAAYDVIHDIPDAVLDTMESAKLLRTVQGMNEAAQRATYAIEVDRLNQQLNRVVLRASRVVANYDRWVKHVDDPSPHTASVFSFYDSVEALRQFLKAPR